MSSQTIVGSYTFKSIYGNLNLPMVNQLSSWTIALTSTIFSLFIGSYLYSQFSYYRLARKYKSRIPRITSIETEGGVHQSIHCENGRLVDTLNPNVKTMYDSLKNGVSISGDGPCIGTYDESKKAYTWQSYNEIWARCEAFVAGLTAATGIGARNSESDPQDFVGFWSLNRAEFVVAQYGVLMQSLVVVPLYDTLGFQAMRHIIRQTGMRVIVCDRIAKVETLLSDMGSNASEYRDAKLRYVVLMDAPGAGELKPGETRATTYEAQVSAGARAALEARGIQLLQMAELERVGGSVASRTQHIPPKPRDIAFLCYTSGTTGVPKGVILTHRNMVANSQGIVDYLRKSIRPPAPSDTYLSYLPMAHMLEQSIQAVIFCYGVRIAFYRRDLTKLIEDLNMIKPNFFAAVPRVLNRVYAKVQEQVSKSLIKRIILKLAIRSKMNDIRRGIARCDTIWDRLVFRKIRQGLGGRVRLMVVGSAPTSDEVLNFFRCALSGSEDGDGTVANGYGQTEGVAGAFLSLPYETEPGHVGGPFPCVEAMLVDVPEMGLVVARDHRGEICLRGPIVSPGYYQDEANTRATFEPLEFPEAEMGVGAHTSGAGGGGWLHTGDIGYWTPAGGLKIVDRKKHIFKLAQGEYLAPEKIESVYQQSKYVAQVLVDGNSFQVYPVAFVTMEKEKLLALGAQLGLSDKNPVTLAKNKKVRETVLAELTSIGKKASLTGFEQVKALHIHPEPFTVEEGLLTPTLKLRRNEVRVKFSKELDALYRELQTPGIGRNASDR